MRKNAARYDFDLFTIGAGSGGVAGSRRAASYGAKVGICENSRVGGTCVIRGCVPKKLLVYGAHVADEISDAAGYGWDIGNARFNWEQLIAAKDNEITRLNGVYLRMLADAGVSLIEGAGRMVDRHTIAVGERTVTAERILIATGGRPALPSTPGIEHAITSDQALDLPELPRRILIVGGGYIAVEFAGIFRALGAEVCMALRGNALLSGFDHDVREHLADEMRHRGVAILDGVVVESIRKLGQELTVALTNGTSLKFDQVLYATGRVPNTSALGLAEIGVVTDRLGAVKVDKFSRTSLPNVFAVGDVTNRLTLTPVAIAEARALAETLFNNNPVVFESDVVSTAVFSQPPVASVGMTEEHARGLGKPIDVYRSRFRPMRHTLSGRQEKTLMKLIVDRASDLVLGCHMVGADAAEIMQGMAIALKCSATKKQFDLTVGIHPTSAEEFVTMRDPVPEVQTN